MAGRSNKQTEIIKTLKFTILTSKRQEGILDKLTAKHTFAIIEYLKFFKKQKINTMKPSIENELVKMTIKTELRPIVPFDFKEHTKLAYSALESCCRTALGLYHSYQKQRAEWNKRSESFYSSILCKQVAYIDLDEQGTILRNGQAFEYVINNFTKSSLWRKIQKNKPSEPFTHYKYNAKKIPTFLKIKAGILAYQAKKEINFYQIRDGKFYIKIATLKQRHAEELELKHGDYHLQELTKGRFTGGKLIKNSKRKRWEFHANIRVEKPQTKKSNKRIILGVDLGQVVDATVVALREHEQVKQKDIYFLKEPDLRQKKYNLFKRTKELQRQRKKLPKEKQKAIIKELKQLSGKRETLSFEISHRISKKITDIAQNYIKEGFEVYIAIGRLKGIRNTARKGNGKSRKARGRMHTFAYKRLTEFIIYKGAEIGVNNIKVIPETFTSKTCHKCESTDTERPTQASFICNNCGLQYNADVNGAINIAKRFWVSYACSNCSSLKTTRRKNEIIYCLVCKKRITVKKTVKQNSEQIKSIFLITKRQKNGLSKFQNLCSKPQGTHDTPTRNESAGMRNSIKG